MIMKNYDEMFQKVLARREEYEKKKKKRTVIIKRTAAAVFGTAAVLGIGLTTYVLRPPKKPTPNQSGIIAETETTSAETTVTPTSLSTSFQKTTATKQMTSTNQVTTTAVSTATPTSSVQKIATTVYTAKLTSSVTTVSVLTTLEQTLVQSNTTTVSCTVNTATTTRIQETTSHITTTFIQMATTSVTTTTSQDNAVYERMIAQNFKNISLNGKEYTRDTTLISAEYADELLWELTLEPTMYTDELPPQITAKVYSIKGIDSDKIIVVICERSKKYRLYKCAEYSAAELAEYISYIKEKYIE